MEQFSERSYSWDYYFDFSTEEIHLVSYKNLILVKNPILRYMIMTTTGYETFIRDYIFWWQQVWHLSVIIITAFIGILFFLLLKFFWQWYTSESKNELKMVIIESLREEWREFRRDFSHFKDIEKIIDDYELWNTLQHQLQVAKKSHDNENIHIIEMKIFARGPGIYIPLNFNLLYKYRESQFHTHYHTFIEDLLHTNIYEYKNFYPFYMACNHYYSAVKILMHSLGELYDISEQINLFFQQKDMQDKNTIYQDNIPEDLKHKNEITRREISIAYKNMKKTEQKIRVFFENSF